MVHIFNHIFKVGLGIRYIRGGSATVPDSLYANTLSSFFDTLRDNQFRKNFTFWNVVLLNVMKFING